MEPTVIYNGACPICRREFGAYMRHCTNDGVAIRFADLNTTDLSAYGIMVEDARRRLYLIDEDRVASGLPAFLILWQAMPRFRWLARLLGLPVIRPMAGLIYDRVLAPMLHALDRRRRRIACSGAPR